MECGGLTVDAVAATGAASKATVYPPWTRTASLVFAAITVSVRHGADLIDTGTLRGYRLAGAQGNACTPRRNSATGICTGYVVLRSIVVGWPTHDRTVQILDDIVVPTLT
ncbi:hypothetical protein MGAD_31590 [Mycolicibacterium gadium]|uniref:Uncharacterized protein n=2 Tax=Mycolicibacterium gadium TaxID=1794 RepID=A0A7I7WMQ4_MYCGU|nr:hypothetical protein MGAD_31590 [Mycolicibacterium gadium]